MSRENLEVLRQLTDAFNGRDVPVFLNCCDPDIEIEAGRVLIGTPTYLGHRGVEQLFRDMTVAWEELRAEAAEVKAIGDAFVVRGEVSGQGKTAGVPFATSRMAAYVKFRGAKMVRCEFFPNEQEALKAAGLSE
jgi:ketosteroid isomerase-like protein